MAIGALIPRGDWVLGIPVIILHIILLVYGKEVPTTLMQTNRS